MFTFLNKYMGLNRPEGGLMKTILILLALFAIASIIATIFFLILYVIAWISGLKHTCEDLDEMSDKLDRRG